MLAVVLLCSFPRPLHLIRCYSLFGAKCLHLFILAFARFFFDPHAFASCPWALRAHCIFSYVPIRFFHLGIPARYFIAYPQAIAPPGAEALSLELLLDFLFLVRWILGIRLSESSISTSTCSSALGPSRAQSPCSGCPVSRFMFIFVFISDSSGSRGSQRRRRVSAS